MATESMDQSTILAQDLFDIREAQVEEVNRRSSGKGGKPPSSGNGGKPPSSGKRRQTTVGSPGSSGEAATLRPPGRGGNHLPAEGEDRWNLATEGDLHSVNPNQPVQKEDPHFQINHRCLREESFRNGVLLHIGIGKSWEIRKI